MKVSYKQLPSNVDDDDISGPIIDDLSSVDDNGDSNEDLTLVPGEDEDNDVEMPFNFEVG